MVHRQGGRQSPDSRGCDRQFATCRDRFGNAVNFRGFPHMPGEEAVLRYPNRGDANTGAPLRPRN